MIGKGVISNLIDVCKKLGFRSSVYILTGPKVYEIIAKKIVKEFDDAQYKVDISLIKEPNVDTALEVMERLSSVNSEVILGIGGGKVIDVAKICSTRYAKPFISVPTAASHDGIASPRASLKGLNKLTSIQAEAPIAVLADTDIILRAPFKLTAAGCGDVISKYTAIRDWELGHKAKNEYYGEYAANLALMSATLVMRNAKVILKRDEMGLRMVLEALISCGVAISIAGSSRPCSGSEHLFSHALDKLTNSPALHGEQCGVGTIMMAYLQKRNWKKIREKLKLIGAPVSASELEVSDKDIIDALVQAHLIRPNRYTILGDKGLTREEAEHLAVVTRVVT